METRREEKKRFEIERLEERIAPSKTLIVTPPAGSSGDVPSGGTTVHDAAVVADGRNGVSVS